ncbi:MAG: OmpA family protein, partial [Bacteroidota bacterium]
ELEKYMFEEAIVSLTDFLNSSANKSGVIEAEANRWIEWCRRSKEAFDNPRFFELHPLGEEVNSDKAELSPVFFADKEELLFLSNQDPANPDDFRVFHTEHTGNRDWSDITEISNVGSFSEENANIEVVAEDGRLFQFRTDKGGDLFYSEPSESRTGWSDPVEFDSKISTTHLSSHFFINEHEDRIVFTKNVGTKRKPNLNLFESFRDPETGKWSDPAPFALVINSEFNEDSPYLTADESTLYFASDGHHTIGGYDVFRSTFDPASNEWSEPESLGFPINSPDDELYFKMSADEKSGYFSSNRTGTLGDFDIYFFFELNTVKIEGRVVNATLNKPVGTGRIFFRPADYEQMYFYSAIDENGKYSVEVPDDQLLKVEWKRADGKKVSLGEMEIHNTEGIQTTYIKDFSFGKAPVPVVYEEQVSNPDPSNLSNDLGFYDYRDTDLQQSSTSQLNGGISAASRERHQQKHYEHGEKRVFTHIYFDFGTAHLKKESIEDLEEMYLMLTDEPEMIIEVAGHTDNKGDSNTNLIVSKQRADAVKNWLVDKGVNAERIQTKGYGEAFPLASNDDEENGRELNRRIEVTIL